MLGLNLLNCALSFALFNVIKGNRSRVESDDQDALLERAAAFEPAALALLYDQYSSRIYSYVYHRVNDAELAEDLTGQVFMRMLEAVRSGRPWRSSFSGWLYRIAHNLVIDYYRRRDRAAFVELDETSPADEDCEPFKAVQTRLENERVQRALDQLTDEQAEVITLRFLEGLSIAEVATTMGKTEGAIKALQYRAVLALRRVMHV
jgi:RNA polymerase sigma-70 factor, ECF subfamily